MKVENERMNENVPVIDRLCIVTCCEWHVCLSLVFYTVFSKFTYNIEQRICLLIP